MKRTMIAAISGTMEAKRNCLERGNMQDAVVMHNETLRKLENLLPSGSGIDCGTKIDFDASSLEKVVLHLSYHHMNDVGYYVGWTEHTLTIKPGFDGIRIIISGPNRNDIKEYLQEVYQTALLEEIEI